MRLRKPGDDGTFYPYDFILGTMLHEITHNVQGPHNAAFYKMLDTLTEVGQLRILPLAHSIAVPERWIIPKSF